MEVWSTPQPCGIITLALWIANDSPTRDWLPEEANHPES